MSKLTLSVSTPRAREAAADVLAALVRQGVRFQAEHDSVREEIVVEFTGGF